MILKNVDLSFLARKKKKFKELLRDANIAFGGGYCSGKTTSSSINGNTITTNLSCASLNYKLLANHTYLIGVRCSKLYRTIKTTNSGNMNGVELAANGTDVVKVVADSQDSVSFSSHPYLSVQQPSSVNEKETATFELYLYDITGEDASKFESFTFEQLASGTISVYED